jgi:hypothetical protein
MGVELPVRTKSMGQKVAERRYLTKGELVVIRCNKKCNIRLMDDVNFEQFKRGSVPEYLGGFYHILPAKIIVPASGYWNIDVDAGWLDPDVKCEIDCISGGYAVQRRNDDDATPKECSESLP